VRSEVVREFLYFEFGHLLGECHFTPKSF
jgi:hypothetical protein